MRVTTVSYAHKFASQTIANWLREAASRVGLDRTAKWAGLSWKVTQNYPTWGVFQEYCVGELNISDRTVLSWNTVPWKEKLLKVAGSFCDDDVPSYRQLATLARPPQLVLDVAVQEGGRVKYGFEVFHKHRVPQYKADLL